MKSKSIWLILGLFLTIVLLFFYPSVLRGHLPFPGDLLVGHYAPWNAYSFLGFAPGGVPHKAQGIDVVRQHFPWKHFSVEMIKNGELPFWNPYFFSGNPHLANFQTGIFYPLNLVFLIFPFNLAWTLFIALQPLLAAVFMYFFLREIKVSHRGAFLGGLVFGFNLFAAVWMEYGNIGHAFLWLPLALLWVEKLIKEGKLKWGIVFTLTLAVSILAGFIQLTIYIYGVVLAYFFFRLFGETRGVRKVRKRIFLFLGSMAVSLLLGLVQLWPTWEIFRQSARGAYPAEKIPDLLLPWFYPITAFVSDFFGNPASRNYWYPGTYIERVAYFGVLPLFFALMAVFYRRKEKIVVFFAALAAGSLLFTLNLWPIRFFYSLKIPIISTTVFTRLLFVFSFAGAVLAGFGLDWFMNEKTPRRWPDPDLRSDRGLLRGGKIRKIVYSLVLFGSVYVFLWLFTFLASRIFPSSWWVSYLSVSRRNLIIPTGILAVFSGISRFGLLKDRLYKKITLSAILLLTIFDLFYYFHKITPFSPPEFVYPKTSVMKFIQNKAGINRFWGYGTAYVDGNFSTFDHSFSVEGWDALYIRRYGELMTASRNRGVIPQEIPRSDAFIEKGYGREALKENFYRQRLLDLLGVKYLLHKNESLGKEWQPDYHTFPEDIYQLVWQESPWQVYENQQALPRIFLLNDFEVIEEDQAIIDRIFSKEFDLSKTVILEEEFSPDLGLGDINGSGVSGGKKDDGVVLLGGEGLNKAVVSIANYSPNRVSLTVETDQPGFLFLSDNYYPGWRAVVDGQEAKIYRANYSFRAILVPEGKHQAVFSYQPASFRQGAVVSGITLAGIVLVDFLAYQRKKR